MKSRRQEEETLVFVRAVATRTLIAARNRAILERAKAGAFFPAISRELGLPYNMVFAVCQRAGIKTPRAPYPSGVRRVREKDPAMMQRDQQIVEQVRAGRYLVEVARAFGISHQRVHQICQSAGVVSRVMKRERRAIKDATRD